jgi:DNA repair ATPase RecN
MLETLEDEPRIKELAAMIGGRQYSETSLDNARELMQKAESWKQARRE